MDILIYIENRKIGGNINNKDYEQGMKEETGYAVC